MSQAATWGSQWCVDVVSHGWDRFGVRLTKVNADALARAIRKACNE
jgi:hypothetical protein